MKYEVATCFNSFNINLFYSTIWSLNRRQNENLASKLGKVAHAWSRQCGILNVSQPYWPLRPVTGIALPYLTCNVTGLVVEGQTQVVFKLN
jgi:hypothetical protein